MGKVIPFKPKDNSKLTKEEEEACEITRQIKDLFTEEELEEIRKEFEGESKD